MKSKVEKIAWYLVTGQASDYNFAVMMKGILSVLLCSCLSLGLLAQELNQVDEAGRKQGPWKKYYENSEAVFYKGQFKDDSPIGTFTYFYRDGSKKGEMTYRADGYVSNKTYYPKTGQLMAEGRYIDQKKDSTWNYYSRSGGLASVENYIEGAKEGEEIVYFDNGEVAELTTHKDGLRNGPWVQKYDNGQVKVSGTFVQDELEGPVEYFFMNGAKEITGKFQDGLREGTWMYFNKDGSVRYQAVYREGEITKERKENGVFEERGPDDILLSSYTYKNGMKQGPFAEYYDEFTYEYEEMVDQRTGETYTKQILVGNELKREGAFKDDKLHGEVKHYNEKGILVAKENYINGEKQ
jgi:antitoxin component YwqK of YwqJK toxin-antitoxin module